MSRREGVQRRAAASYLEGPVGLADTVVPSTGTAFVTTTGTQTLSSKTFTSTSLETAICGTLRSSTALVNSSGATTRYPFDIVDLASGVTASATGTGSTSYLQVVSAGAYAIAVQAYHGAASNGLRQIYATVQLASDSYNTSFQFSLAQNSSSVAQTLSAYYVIGTLAVGDRCGASVLNNGASATWGSASDTTLQVRLSLIKLSAA